MDVSAWLHRLGLGQYEQAFVDNDIDGDVLPTLSADELRELGVTSLGHRKKLLAAIAKLARETAASRSPRAMPERGALCLRRDAERRQLTVMFVDLVGSTALSARLDPEDMGEVIRTYQNAVAGEIGRFEGHVAKYMGDGVLVYFGYPQAREDEAERAVRAGLAVIDAVRGLVSPGGEPLAARVGIATGLVVVGDLVGSEEAQERAVVGETPNLAARLQSLAEPGQVVIADSTRRLVGDLFECVDLGVQSLKGFAAAVVAWRVLGASAAESRFEARHAGGLTPMVGREHEIALLLDRWAAAKEGEGQVMLLAGEAGIGKSRITQALLERLSDEPYTRLRYYGSPYHTNSALHPVIAQLERAAGFHADDGAGAKLDKLEAVLRRASEPMTETASLLAALLALPSEERCPPLNLTPQAQKARTLAALLGQLAALAARQPVLMVFEDAHWIDPTTTELFEQVIERVQHLPVLLLITFRPEFAPPWAGHAHTTTLTLNRLGRHQGAAIVARLTGGKPLPAEVMDQILAKTDGVPLFVEELTKTVLESGLIEEQGERYILTGPLTSLTIPSTLHDSLMARLDRLAPVKEVAQIGAVIGREFAHDLLAAVSPLPGDELTRALDQLVAAELIFRRGTPPEASYTFKHALVQDAAYQSLLNSRRQQLHGQIAEALEARFPDTTDAEPELLAHHLTEAGQPERAVDYWSKAGRRALGRSAYAEALDHLSTGLELLKPLAASAERHRRELELQNSWAQALLATRGWAAPETGEAFAKARQLCEQLGNPLLIFAVLRGLQNFHLVRAEHAIALDIAHECLDLAEQKDDGAAAILGHRLIGQTLFALGELTAGRNHLERAIALYDPQRHGASALVYGTDSRLDALAHLSYLLWVVGYPERACRAADEALSDAEQQERKHDLVHTRYLALYTRLLRREYHAVLQGGEMALASAHEHGLGALVLLADILSGWARLALSKRGEDVDPLVRSINAKRVSGADLRFPFQLGCLAEGLAANGRVEEALATVAEAMEVTERTGERWSEAELHRLKGEILLARDGLDVANEAEACFRRSLDIAREQSAKSWELRTATSLARLWRDQGKHAEARDLLASVYNWFTEGFDTADLKDAKTLLDQLA